MSGTYSTATIHGHSHGHGHGHGHDRSSSVVGTGDDFRDSIAGFAAATTPRRTTLDKAALAGFTAIPTPASRRQSGGLAGTTSTPVAGGVGPGRRISAGRAGEGDMGPPERGRKKLGGVGETY